MAMLLVLPKLPRDVVEHIRTYVYGPQIAAFIANYGERIPARVLLPTVLSWMPYIPSLELSTPWNDGLRPRYKRYLWRLP